MYLVPGVLSNKPFETELIGCYYGVRMRAHERMRTRFPHDTWTPLQRRPKRKGNKGLIPLWNLGPNLIAIKLDHHTTMCGGVLSPTRTLDATPTPTKTKGELGSYSPLELGAQPNADQKRSPQNNGPRGYDFHAEPGRIQPGVQRVPSFL